MRVTRSCVALTLTLALVFSLAATFIFLNAPARGDFTPLMKAASNGDVPTVHLLLAQPTVQVHARDADGWTALMYATVRGHVDLVKVLLAQPSVDVNAANANGDTALTLAAMKGHATTVHVLLAHPGVDLNAANGKRQRTARMVAAAEATGPSCARCWPYPASTRVPSMPPTGRP
jgi:ankyrin repeat protein